MIEFTIFGQPFSKANSRRRTKWGGVIKSEKAIKYVSSFSLQCPRLDELMTKDVMVEGLIWYESWRPDLDESLILDCMQGLIYKNDRQVRDKRFKGSKDKDNPRSIIRVTEIDNLIMEFD